jgi:hypothetical protein
VGPGFIKDGDMQGLSEGPRQQLDEGKWLCVFGGGCSHEKQWGGGGGVLSLASVSRR